MFYRAGKRFRGGAQRHAKVYLEGAAHEHLKRPEGKAPFASKYEMCDSSKRNGRFCRAALSQLTEFEVRVLTSVWRFFSFLAFYDVFFAILRGRCRLPRVADSDF